MRVVTTCHKAGFDEYGYRCLETFKNWPNGSELWWYTEGYRLPYTDNVVEVDNINLPRLQAFKAKYAHFKAPHYLYDVVRFCHKVYAMHHAVRDYDGISVWLDADCVTYKPIPENYIESHLRGAYIALFKRAGMYSECGFWIIDGSHPEHRNFMDFWLNWYESEAFKSLANWTDCEALDATIRNFEKRGLIRSESLSGRFDKMMHPLSASGIGKYIDHCKGDRKQAGFSPENTHRLSDEPYHLNDTK